ncbi:N-acetylaspartylglutamate synthase A [Acipenser ruthenus]|uniref:N-acetylaspartylglutamate synthase A n=1 Tax=Acipenser ruthenus TaxID=7906 RepID=A0A444V5I3_ACIRT|nr:N-acetylaspartylglutamate synthase A [Acipenser ruthenus]
MNDLLHTLSQPPNSSATDPGYITKDSPCQASDRDSRGRGSTRACQLPSIRGTRVQASTPIVALSCQASLQLPSPCSPCYSPGLVVRDRSGEQGRQLAVQVSNILGMDVCGIDLLMKDDGSFVVCEANANVGFIAFDRACGLDVGGIIADYTLSLLPSRLTRKMSLLSVVSSASETSSEPEVCLPASAIPEAVYAMSAGSTSSESDPELPLPDTPFNMNSISRSEIKLLTE